VEKEELFGLSSKAIDRWVTANRVDQNLRLVLLIKTIFRKTFFLANKSQETISPEYKAVPLKFLYLPRNDRIRDELAVRARVGHKQGT